MAFEVSPVMAPDSQNQNIIMDKKPTEEIEGIEPEKSVNENVITQTLENNEEAHFVEADD